MNRSKWILAIVTVLLIASMFLPFIQKFRQKAFAE